MSGAPNAAVEAELNAAAEEELERALDLSWTQLRACLPWGDTYQGIAPSGREVCFERSYLWADRAGGDILVEVVVFEPEAYEAGARISRTLTKPR